MKKTLLSVAILAMLSFIKPYDPLTEKERKDAIQLLKSSEQDLLEEIKGMPEAQLKYKPAPDRWSVEECVIHIAITEQMLWQMTEASIREAANPEKRAEIKMTDEQVIKGIADRSEKRQTFDNLKPENAPFKSMQAALESLKNSRIKLTEYVKSTTDDMRNHVLTFPFGSLDSYQMLLFIAAHGNRHLGQIREVKADAGFPKQ